MGWGFRRSISIGPVRVNLGKTGLGYSVGGRGFRTGIRSNGRRYTVGAVRQSSSTKAAISRWATRNSRTVLATNSMNNIVLHFHCI
jgi:hypothetical protein